MVKRLLISLTKLTGSHDASVKPRTDIDQFLKDPDTWVVNVPIDVNSKFSKAVGIGLTLSTYLREAIASANRQVIYIQYPAYSAVVMDHALKILRKGTSSKIVLIVHDIESLRMSADHPKFLTDEIRRFNSVDGLIVHNQAMADWLNDHGVTVPMSQLQLFDYVNPQRLITDTTSSNICFAGNLRKAQFLNAVPFKQVQVDVFGDGLTLTNSQLIDHGSKSPDELPKYLTDRFGLIWDGDSANTCSGEYGEYLKYNSPHKASLYLSSGLPVIVWSQSALAPVVESLGVGFAVDSLADIEPMLNKLSDSDDRRMKAAALIVALKLRSGQMIQSAVNSIEQKLQLSSSN